MAQTALQNIATSIVDVPYPSMGPLMGTNKAAWGVKLLLMNVVSNNLINLSHSFNSASYCYSCMKCLNTARLDFIAHTSESFGVSLVRENWSYYNALL